jgi:hypothetical protein
MIQSRTDISDSRAKSYESIISILEHLIIGCLGPQPIFLTAKEVVAPCRNMLYHAGYILFQRARKMPMSDLLMFFFNQRTYIDLGRVSKDHWGHRAISGQDRKTILKMEELLEFLNLVLEPFKSN